MNKIKVIDLLNMISKGEEVPKRIKYRNKIFIYDKDNQCYVVENYNEYDDLHMSLSNHKGIDLNYKVEILEEENKKCTVETCCMGIEGLSKTLLKIKDDMKRIYENINKVETLEEEKKIPEKLNYKYRNMYGHISQHKQSEIDIIDTLNGVIDYLKSKGDE